MTDVSSEHVAVSYHWNKVSIHSHPVLPPPAVHPSEQHDEAQFGFQHGTENSLLWERLFKDNKF